MKKTYYKPDTKIVQFIVHNNLLLQSTKLPVDSSDSGEVEEFVDLLSRGIILEDD